MRHEIRYFLENTKDESIVRFILSNLSKFEIDDIFELLTQCEEISEDFWQECYSKMYFESK